MSHHPDMSFAARVSVRQDRLQPADCPPIPYNKMGTTRASRVQTVAARLAALWNRSKRCKQMPSTSSSARCMCLQARDVRARRLDNGFVSEHTTAFWQRDRLDKLDKHL